MARRRPNTLHVSVSHHERRSRWRQYATAVSLHAHTSYSREVLADLPRYLVQIPFVGSRVERELRTECAVDFSKGWWHPPVDPHEVFASEAAQIGDRLELAPMVSLSDHDDLRAGLDLQAVEPSWRAPLSFEWTVPYGPGYFHFGVHNLPPADAQAWFARLGAFTADPEPSALPELLDALNAEPDLLIVFNHPWWDLAGVGADTHAVLLQHFLRAHADRLHALELNGYRSRLENDRVRLLASEVDLPVISGGDRHGCAPNALLNLTRAKTFAEFVDEVRDGRSDVLIMPEYRQHLLLRTLASASDVMRHYPWRHERQHWTDRVTYEADGLKPLSAVWPGGGPFWVRSSVRVLHLLTSPLLRPMVGAAFRTVDPRLADEGVRA
jgi:hypothetical protein